MLERRLRPTAKAKDVARGSAWRKGCGMAVLRAGRLVGSTEQARLDGSGPWYESKELFENNLAACAAGVCQTDKLLMNSS